MQIFPSKSMEKFPWNSMEIDVLIFHGIPFHGGFSHGNYHAYGLCLNKKRSKFNLVSRSNFFKTWKNYYIPEICKNSKASQLRINKTDSRWIHFRQIFLGATETHAIFLLLHLFLWCSFTNNAWSHGINERNQNNSPAKALRILIFLWRSKMQLLVTS